MSSSKLFVLLDYYPHVIICLNNWKYIVFSLRSLQFYYAYAKTAVSKAKKTTDTAFQEQQNPKSVCLLHYYLWGTNKFAEVQKQSIRSDTRKQEALNWKQDGKKVKHLQIRWARNLSLWYIVCVSHKSGFPNILYSSITLDIKSCEAGHVMWWKTGSQKK